MSQKGFTLLELLISITLVGILSAIAIPHYRSLRAAAYDTRAKTDLRNLALAEEVYFSDNEEYLPCENESCYSLPTFIKFSDGVSGSVSVSEDDFIATATHKSGTKNFIWDSKNGGLDEQ